MKKIKLISYKENTFQICDDDNERYIEIKYIVKLWFFKITREKLIAIDRSIHNIGEILNPQIGIWKSVPLFGSY